MSVVQLPGGQGREVVSLKSTRTLALNLKKKKKCKRWDAIELERLPRMCGAPSSIPSIAKQMSKEEKQHAR